MWQNRWIKYIIRHCLCAVSARHIGRSVQHSDGKLRFRSLWQLGLWRSGKLCLAVVSSASAVLNAGLTICFAFMESSMYAGCYASRHIHHVWLKMPSTLYDKLTYVLYWCHWIWFVLAQNVNSTNSCVCILFLRNRTSVDIISWKVIWKRV